MLVLLFDQIVSEPPGPFNPDDSWACTNPVYVVDRDADGPRPAGPLPAPIAVAHAGNPARVVEEGRGGAVGRGTHPLAGACPPGGQADFTEAPFGARRHESRARAGIEKPAGLRGV